MSIAEFSEKATKRLTALEDAAFIAVCYRILLNRAPDLPGYENYLEVLRNGMPKADVLAAFLSSDEYQMNRAGDTAGISMFVEAAGSLDFSARDFLNSVSAKVHVDRMNLLPG